MARDNLPSRIKVKWCLVAGSRHDGLIFTVPRDQSMNQSLPEGTLYIQSTDHNWDLSFVPNAAGLHGSTGVYPCEGDEGLIAFLEELGIPQERIDNALKELRLQGNASTHPVWLSPEQIHRYRL
jgi:hypothetical protein